MGSLVVACELLVAACMWNLVPWPGIEPGPRQWKCGILTTRPRGNSFRPLTSFFPFNNVSWRLLPVTTFFYMVQNIPSCGATIVYLADGSRVVSSFCLLQTLLQEITLPSIRLNPGPQQWKRRVLTTGLPGNSQGSTHCNSHRLWLKVCFPTSFTNKIFHQTLWSLPISTVKDVTRCSFNLPFSYCEWHSIAISPCILCPFFSLLGYWSFCWFLETTYIWLCKHFRPICGLSFDSFLGDGCRADF